MSTWPERRSRRLSRPTSQAFEIVVLHGPVGPNGRPSPAAYERRVARDDTPPRAKMGIAGSSSTAMRPMRVAPCRQDRESIDRPRRQSAENHARKTNGEHERAGQLQADATEQFSAQANQPRDHRPAGEVAPVELSRPGPVLGFVTAEVPIAAPEEEHRLSEHHGDDRYRRGAGERVGARQISNSREEKPRSSRCEDCPVIRDMEQQLSRGEWEVIEQPSYTDRQYRAQIGVIGAIHRV